MGNVRLTIQIPKPIKAKLDALKAQGTSAADLIRHLLTQYFNAPKGQKGR